MANFTFRCEREDISKIHKMAGDCGYKTYGSGGATRFALDVLSGLAELQEEDELAFLDFAKKCKFKKL